MAMRVLCCLHLEIANRIPRVRFIERLTVRITYSG
jgi:hypothetical protein